MRRVDAKRARGIGSLLYEDWRPLFGMRRPAYGIYPVPEKRLALVVDRIMSLCEEG